jgi:uncharacterized protein (TIGR03792 family)
MALLRQLAGLALLLLLVLVPLNPASGAQPYEVVVVEHLRLKVPEAGVDAWLTAERGSWEPWLAEQPGFLDRQLLWDAEREEGTLLIHWASREQWKAISSAQVQAVQQRFEALARQASGISQGNPFPLIFEGELAPL